MTTLKEKIIKIFAILFALNLFFIISCKMVYADAINPSNQDLRVDLTESQEIELENFDTLAKMITDIFSFDKEYGDNSLNDAGALLYELIEDSLLRWDMFTNSIIYRYIQGLALLFVMIGFMIKIYEDNQFDFEGEVVTKSMIRSCIYFVFVLLIIMVLKYYIQFLLAFFRFLIDRIIVLKSNNDLGEVTALLDTIKPKTVAYYVLNDSGLVGSGSLIQEVAIRSKEASLRSMYILPWIITWICKVGELILIFLNSMLFILYGTFYPISLYDALTDLKTSNFLVYSRHLTSIAVSEIVIITTIYVSDLFLNPYLNRVLDNIASGNSNLSYVSMAIIVTSIFATKFIALVMTIPLSKKILGV